MNLSQIKNKVTYGAFWAAKAMHEHQDKVVRSMAELRKLDLSCMESGNHVNMGLKKGRVEDQLTIIGFVFHDRWWWEMKDSAYRITANVY